MFFCMTSLNTICQNMKLKLVKMIKNFIQNLELLGDRLEVCVSVYVTNKMERMDGANPQLHDMFSGL